MFKKKNKHLLILILIVNCMYSCKSDMDLKVYYDIEQYESTQFASYESIYNDANRTFQEMVDQRNGHVKPMFFGGWEISKICYINSSGTRMFSSINVPSQTNGAKMDVVLEFIGVKIDQNWYFLIGDQIAYQRDIFKDDISTAYSLEELSYLFNHGIFPSIVSKVGNEYIVLEDFFQSKLKQFNSENPDSDSLFRSKANIWMSHRMNKEDYDKIIARNLKYKPAVDKENNSKRNLFTKKKLLENKAWKNRHKKN